MTDTQAARLRRKLTQRDQRIAGLERRIKSLEHALVMKDIEVKRMPIDVSRAVQQALCNVRMIPMTISSRIREVDVEVVARETEAKL